MCEGTGLLLSYRRETIYTLACECDVEGIWGEKKTEALELIRKLPDDVTTGAIMEELFFKQQVEKGLQDVAEGRVLTHEELKERIARWRKSAGR